MKCQADKQPAAAGLVQQQARQAGAALASLQLGRSAGRAHSHMLAPNNERETGQLRLGS